MNRFYRMLTVLLAALLTLLLAVPAMAVEEQAPSEELTALMEQFLSDYGLNENNFSVCYRNTVTGETYRYNDTAFMVAASTYKLPLNLYYYELEQSGELSPDSYVGGMTLSDAHYQSLVWSNNDVSIDMLYNLGNFRTYKEKMRKYFTMEDSEIDSVYYGDNYYCTSMMLDALSYLYDNREQFSQMIDYMKQAQPGQYFDRYMDEYEVAHKYGYFVDDDKGVTAVNDTGIVYTAEPFLLAVYTANAPGGEEVVAQACRLLADYTTAQYEEKLAEQQALEQQQQQQEQQQEPAEPITEEPEPAITEEEPKEEEPVEEEPAPEAEESPKSSDSMTVWTVVLAAAVVFLIVDVVFLIRAARRKKQK